MSCACITSNNFFSLLSTLVCVHVYSCIFFLFEGCGIHCLAMYYCYQIVRCLPHSCWFHSSLSNFAMVFSLILWSLHLIKYSAVSCSMCYLAVRPKCTSPVLFVHPSGRPITSAASEFARLWIWSVLLLIYLIWGSLLIVFALVQLLWQQHRVFHLMSSSVWVAGHLPFHATSIF